MDPWSTLMRMVDEELIDERRLDCARRIVQSAALAKISYPRASVAAAIIERLELGIAIDDALESVEDMVAVQHNRMLIESCRLGFVDDTPLNVVRRWRHTVGRPFPPPEGAALLATR